MPIKIDGFQCAKCLYVHTDFETAENCESKHGTNLEYTPEFEKGKIGPSAIKCKFTKENGDQHERHYY